MKKLAERLEAVANDSGAALVATFHLLALFAIGATIAWSALFAFFEMARQGYATVEDILLLFIYLELGAMVGIYFATKRMPVRFLIYVAITALTRLIIAVVNVDHKPDIGVVYVAGAILMLSGAVLVLRFGEAKYPSSHAAVALKPALSGGTERDNS